MAANTEPRFPLSADSGWATLTAANTATDGTGTVSTIFTAGANGGRVKSVVIKPLGTNNQTVLRIFLNNGGTNTSATNNSLIREITIASSTASNTTAQPDYEVVLDMDIEASHTIIIAIGTAAAAGIAVSAIGSQY